MRILRSSSELNSYLETLNPSKKLGFVPTMGSLHQGHLSLVKASQSCCDTTLLSIFVNPSQFGPMEDFSKYPRPIGKDIALLEAENVDALFLPRVSDIYPFGLEKAIYVKAGALASQWCAASRPGHFDGVCTVVLKLFQLITPDIAFFGEKDFQQLAIIKRMLNEFFISIDIHEVATVRDQETGLALSSRNQYLNQEEQAQSSRLYRTLKLGQDLFDRGETDAELILNVMHSFLMEESRFKIDYIGIIDEQTLESVCIAKAEHRIVIAALFQGVRLIDNLKLGKVNVHTA